MKKAILKEVQEIRSEFQSKRQSGVKASEAMEELADKYECSIDRIRDIVYRKKVPYESQYTPKKKAV
ncbi:MAG: hypothetical protein MN733_34555 [Nitrososphaera sp.]|nr:hypothetical protein [Nitrososphaera sp.]